MPPHSRQSKCLLAGLWPVAALRCTALVLFQQPSFLALFSPDFFGASFPSLDPHFLLKLRGVGVVVGGCCFSVFCFCILWLEGDDCHLAGIGGRESSVCGAQARLPQEQGG